MKKSWLKSWLTFTPHFIVGGEDDPYLLRWYAVPRNNRLNVYLHKFMRDDDDRALHDHPWWFVSVMLRGGYYEHTTGGGLIRRDVPSIAFRRATHAHRVELLRYSSGKLRPAWTLVITGKRSRVWGFWCPKGFVPWHRFVAPNDVGAVGRGCDQ